MAMSSTLRRPTPTSPRRAHTDAPLRTSSFLDDTDAIHNSLAFVNDAGNAVMKVDNSSSLKFNQNRNSIRISSKDQFTVGSVWVADILHVPYGVRSVPFYTHEVACADDPGYQCSVWGAFWSSAPTWPLGGEVSLVPGRP